MSVKEHINPATGKVTLYDSGGDDVVMLEVFPVDAKEMLANQRCDVSLEPPKPKQVAKRSAKKEG